MTFTDRLLTCTSCQIRFLLSGAQQREQAGAEARADEPVLCPGCRALQGLTARRRGAVRWYDVRKGYGFIQSADGQDVFLHHSDLASEKRFRPKVGQLVEYDLEQTERGYVARVVSSIDE